MRTRTLMYRDPHTHQRTQSNARARASKLCLLKHIPKSRKKWKTWRRSGEYKKRQQNATTTIAGVGGTQTQHTHSIARSIRIPVCRSLASSDFILSWMLRLTVRCDCLLCVRVFYTTSMWPNAVYASTGVCVRCWLRMPTSLNIEQTTGTQ